MEQLKNIPPDFYMAILSAVCIGSVVLVIWYGYIKVISPILKKRQESDESNLCKQDKCLYRADFKGYINEMDKTNEMIKKSNDVFEIVSEKIDHSIQFQKDMFSQLIHKNERQTELIEKQTETLVKLNAQIDLQTQLLINHTNRR